MGYPPTTTPIYSVYSIPATAQSLNQGDDRDISRFIDRGPLELTITWGDDCNSYTYGDGVSSNHRTHFLTSFSIWQLLGATRKFALFDPNSTWSSTGIELIRRYT